MRRASVAVVVPCRVVLCGSKFHTRTRIVGRSSPNSPELSGGDAAIKYESISVVQEAGVFTHKVYNEVGVVAVVSIINCSVSTRVYFDVSLPE